MDEQVLRDFVSAMTPAPVGGNVARFEQSVCPAVLGMQSRQAVLVTQRIRAVAAAAAIPVGAANCRPNVVIIFTPDKRALLSGMNTRVPGFFGNLLPRQIRRLFNTPGPTAYWRLGQSVDTSGRPLDPDFASGVPILRTTRLGSRIQNAAHLAVEGAVLVIQTDALEGLTTTQIADYAALRALTGADPMRLPEASPPTILTLLDTSMGESVPLTMTEWDLAYLTSLYASDPNVYAPGQRSEIRRRMQRRLGTGEGGRDR